MYKKKYETPIAEITEFISEDILTKSVLETGLDDKLFSDTGCLSYEDL